MNTDAKLQRKEAHRQLSIERKLFFLEFSRRFWLLLSTDILIVMLFFAGMLVSCGQIANKVSESNNGELYAVHSSLIESIESVGNIYRRNAVTTWLENLTGQTFIGGGAYFSERYYGQPARTLETLHFSISVPKSPHNNQEYWLVTFRLYEVIVIFEHAFAALLALEAIGLVSDGFKIRRSIRRALRPIYDLTLVAQNINAASPAIALPAAQELHLSGAIDTLNHITENDLGRRIVISDERAELRGLASAINSMLDRLDAAYRSQLRFVSDASHELRTPIAVIQGYANLLDRWGKNDTVTLQESIDAIKSEATGMQDLVEQLLFLARSDNSSIVLNVETVDVTALADEVLRETRMIDPGHEFLPKLNGGLNARGDIQLLKQALRIFVDNAMKYTPSGGRITISTFEEQGYVKISVSDNGIGIPSEDLARVFDRFFRADESRARETGGTGLGLSIAKWIIDRHGGFVELISREDIGTKVNVALPKYAE